MVLRGGPPQGGRKTTGPKGHRAYAVGDVHGRLDLLDQMLSMVEADVRGRPGAKTVIVFLGDLVDRGPDSAQVVERLRLYSPAHADTIFLMGNHEEVMLRVLDGDGPLLRDWMKFGGAECVRSYGIDPAELIRLDTDRALATLKNAIPDAHVDFLRSFGDTLSFGSYLLVHAGIRPGVTLSEQAQTDLRWIRQPFLDDPRDHGFVVVHGHTITPQVEQCGNRIALDTGAYKSGVLTALGIEGARRWLLQTDGDTIARSELDRVSKNAGAPAMACGR